MKKSPPRSLYDAEYYETSCEGFDHSVDNPSPRLACYDSWIKPQLSGGNVADIGFGRGEFTIKTARLPHIDKVWSFDYSPAAGRMLLENLEKEPELGEKINIILSDFVEILPQLDVMFNNVIMFDVIEHIYPDQIKFVTETLDQLMPYNGKIFLSTPLSKEPCNERHVWMASTVEELQAMFPSSIRVTHKGYSGVGEENWFEAVKIK